LKIAGVEYKEAGVKNVQEYLEDNLIGIPQNIFNNSVSLSINDFKPSCHCCTHTFNGKVIK
jgi:hypothetical protein